MGSIRDRVVRFALLRIELLSLLVIREEAWDTVTKDTR
jgi:hypothetical protein